MDFHTASFLAQETLRVIQPEALERPMRVDSVSLIKNSTMLGVSITPIACPQMGSDEGMYDAENRRIDLRKDHWDAIFDGGPGVHRARSTLAHELGHHALRDDPRVTDEEADAWAFAGCLMMPCDVVVHMAEMGPLEYTEVARTFDVSPQFARAHLDRMRRARLL